MKKNFFLSALLLFMVGCSEDGTNLTDSSISIIKPAENNLLIGTVTIEAQIEQSGFEKAEVFIGSTLIGESSEQSINISYDTRNIPDGIYELKIVATNGNGKKENGSIEVQVLNTLLSITFPANWLQDSRINDTWVFITNNAGELLSSLRGGNNVTLSFPTPANYELEDGLVLHHLRYQTIIGGFAVSRTIISSYTDIVPGQNYAIKTPVLFRQSKGSSQLTITDIPEDYSNTILSGNIFFSGYMGYSPRTINSTLYENPTDIVCYLSSPNRSLPGYYKVFENVTTGNSPAASFTNFTAMQSKQVFTPIAVEGLEVRIGVYIDESRTYNSLVDSDYQANTDHVTVHYPGSLYDNYLTLATFTNDNKGYRYEKFGAIPNSVKMSTSEISAFTYTNKIINFSSSGKYDLAVSGSSSTFLSNGNNHELIWSFNTDDKSANTIAVPDIPPQIIAAFPQLNDAIINFNAVSIWDYDKIDDYQDYLRIEFKSNEHLTSVYDEYMLLRINFTGSGRTKTGLFSKNNDLNDLMDSSLNR